jgi:hypothetical protein
MRRFSVLTFLLLSYGCPRLLAESAQPPCATSYKSNFVAGNKSWYTWKPLPGSSRFFLLPVSKGIASSNGPWIVDGNHSGSADTYGVGSLYLVAFAWLRDFYKEHSANLGAEAGEGILEHCVDLSEASVVVSVHTMNFRPNGGRLVFWFQNEIEAVGCELPKQCTGTVTVNYGFNAPVNLNGETRLRLTKKKEDWTCFGAHDINNRFPERSGAGRYGCAVRQKDFEAAVSKVALDFGFVFLLSRKQPASNSPALELPNGVVTLSDIRIESSN